MTYDVYLDDVGFYGIESVSFPNDRKLIVYNGIGTGYFPKADDPQLKRWSWECELQEFPEHYHTNFSAASRMRAVLDKILQSKEPSRLLIKSDYTSVSEQVFLEKYNCKEVYAGVYKFSVNVTEYKEAAVRTTTIPEIPRPGKIPKPKPIKPGDLGENETLYDKSNEASNSLDQGYVTHGHPGGEATDPSGNPVNPLDPPKDKPIIWQDTEKKPIINNITGEKIEYKPFHINFGAIGNMILPNFKDSALGEIVNGYKAYKDKIAKENEGLIKEMLKK